jgi:hypothetical protein
VAIEYVHEIAEGAITVKWLDGAIAHEIHVDATISTLLVQDLLNAIRAAEDTLDGITFGQIATADGKKSLGGGVYGMLTVELLGDWLVYSTKSTGVFRVTGGNLIRHDESDPFRPNNLITYLNIQSAAATIVSIEGGGGGGDGFTSADRAVLNGIEETLAGVASDLTQVGTDVDQLGTDVAAIASTLGTLNLDLTFLKSKRTPKANDDVGKRIKNIETQILDLGKKIRRL